MWIAHRHVVGFETMFISMSNIESLKRKLGEFAQERDKVRVAEQQAVLQGASEG